MTPPGSARSAGAPSADPTPVEGPPPGTGAHTGAPPLVAPRVPTAFSPALAGAAEVVRLVRSLADSQGRDDLVEQLDRIRAQLAVESVPVLVVGGAGQGKSSVVNALVGAGVCAVGATDTTATPTVVSHALAYDGALVIDPAAAGRPEPLLRRVPFTEAVGLATQALNPDNAWGLRAIQLAVPSPALARGLTLIDTPPLRELWEPDGVRLLQAMSGVAAVVLVTSAGSELSSGELDLLRVASSLCHRLYVVVNGTNVFADWRSVVAANRSLLDRRGISAKVLAVAATPYWGDAGGVPPGPDAGMQALAAELDAAVVLDTEHQRISTALVEAFWAADRLRMRLWAEQSLITEDGPLDETTVLLRDAARHAQVLCGPTAHWHELLTQSVQQLRKDVEADLDADVAGLRADVDNVLLALEAGHDWPRLHLSLHTRFADRVLHTQRVRKLAMRALCRHVAEQFQADWSEIVASLDLASEAHALLDPRLDREVAALPRSLADLPRPPAGAASLPGDQSGVPLPTRARADYERWLSATETFLRNDTEATLIRVGEEMERRCQDRGIELQRTIVEVLTTLNVLRHLTPEVVLQRHEEIESDLAQLRTLDFQLKVAPPAG